MENSLKKKLDNGDQAVGTFVWSASSYLVDALGQSGLDYVILDAEHSPVSVDNAGNLIRAAQLGGLTPVVRAKDGSRPAILSMLDLGAEGIIVPNLHTLDQVKAAVDFAKYPPIGRRGFAQCRGAGYGFAAHAACLESYFQVSNRQTLLLPMCETVGLLEQIEEVAALEGVDGIFVGPYDLSLDLGMPGQFAAPVFRQALERIARACAQAGKYAMIYSNTPETAQEHAAMGYQALTMGIDVQKLVQAYREALAQIRGYHQQKG